MVLWKTADKQKTKAQGVSDITDCIRLTCSVPGRFAGHSIAANQRSISIMSIQHVSQGTALQRRGASNGRTDILGRQKQLTY